MKVVYLIGPLSHVPDGGEQEYRLAESCFLNEKQIEALHLHKDLHVRDWTAANEKALIHKAAALMIVSSEVVTLKDWEECHIARRQMKLALDLGMDVKPVLNYFPYGYEKIIG